MFICEFCKNPSKPNEKLTRLVTETREKTYPQRTYKRRGVQDPLVDSGGVGNEIVKECKACSKCVSK